MILEREKSEDISPMQTYAMFAFVALFLLLIGSILQNQDLHIGALASQVLCIGIPAFLFRKRFKFSLPLFGPRYRVTTFIWVLFTTPILAIFANLLAVILMKFSPALMEMGVVYEEALKRLLHPDELWRQVLGFVVISVFAPVFEEYFFRGTLLVAQRKVHRWTTAIVINGLLFSLVHANPVAFISLAIIGMYFASLSKHGVILSVFAHSVLNTTSGVLSFFQTGGPRPEDLEYLNLFVGLGVLLPLVVGSMYFTIRSIHGHDEEFSISSM